MNNERKEIIWMFNTECVVLLTFKILNVTNKWVYNGMNNGVYRCWSAKKQESFEEVSVKKNLIIAKKQES